MIYLSWKLRSGIAHGDFWTAWSAAERIKLPGAPVGTGSANVGQIGLAGPGRTAGTWASALSSQAGPARAGPGLRLWVPKTYATR